MKIDVGPSAPPIIEIAAACCNVKSIPGMYWDKTTAPTNEPKIPNWAAPPSNAVLGSPIKDQSLS